jgi:copper chaperone NosL
VPRSWSSTLLRRRLPGLAALLAVLLISPAALAGPPPSPGEQNLGPDGTLRLGPRDRCPVCAMRPIQYPRFACAIQRTDERTFYFCCPGCLLQAWIRPEAFLGCPGAEVRRAVIQEYFSGALQDARAVLWIAGSDVTGPMGPALVPVSGAEAAEVFRRRHGGRPPFRLEDLTPQSWTPLTGKAP